MNIKKNIPLDFDRIIPIIGIILSILLIAYTSVYIGRIIYVLTAVFALFSCLLWMLISKDASLLTNQYHSKYKFILFLASFSILFLLSILSFHFRLNVYEIPTVYYIFIYLMIGIIILELFSEGSRESLILIQIISLGASIAWSQLLIYPSLTGVDPWWHQMFTTKIINESFIPDNYPYSKLPVFHTIISITYLITGLNYKFATMLSVSLSQIICDVLFTFLLGKYILNHKIALLGSLLIVLSDYHIIMTTNSIPTSLGALYFLPVFYIILKIKERKHITSTFLLIIFMVVSILNHTISPLGLIILLLAYFIGFTIFNALSSHKEKNPISLVYFVLFITTMFSWWTHAATSVLTTLGNLIKWGFDIEYFNRAPVEISIQSHHLPTATIAEQIFENLSIFLFFSLSFIGCFYMTSKRNGTSKSFSFAIAGLTPLFLGFFSLVTQHSIIQQRWWFFSEILLAIPLAASFVLITNKFFKNAYNKSLALVALTLILSFVLIMSPHANVDNHNSLSPNSKMRYALTTSELQAIDTCSNLWVGSLKTDEYYANSQKYNYNYSVSPFSYEIYTKDFDKMRGKLILIRKEIIGSQFKVFSSVLTLDYDLDSQLETLKFSKIYDCGSVNAALRVK